MQIYSLYQKRIYVKMNLVITMKAVGIICEYNPFHNGHLYHINEIKKQFPNYPIILVLSGNFTERGIVSILDKWKKTKLALTYGVDLVIELPFVFATQSADIFAKGSIAILKALQVEYLVFGSESGTAEPLIKMAKIQLENPNYDSIVKEYLNQGMNYPTAMSKALEQAGNEKISTPNDLLGLSYIKEIIKQKADITPIAITRTNDYHEKELDNHIASATAIRTAILNNKDITNVVPEKTAVFLKQQTIFMESFYPFFQYKVATTPNLEIYQTVDEGIQNRIKEEIWKHDTLEDFIQATKTKRYTYNKMMRMITHILCSFTKEEAKVNQDIHYLRILGMNEIGQAYFNQIKKEIDLPVITACNSIQDSMIDIELRSTYVFASLLKEKEPFIHQEYSKKPILYHQKKL